MLFFKLPLPFSIIDALVYIIYRRLHNEFSDTFISDLLDHQVDELAHADCRILGGLERDDLLEHVSDALIQGKVVGWFRGRKAA